MIGETRWIRVGKVCWKIFSGDFLVEKLLHFWNPKDVHMVLPLIIVGRSDFALGNRIFYYW